MQTSHQDKYNIMGNWNNMCTNLETKNVGKLWNNIVNRLGSNTVNKLGSNIVNKLGVNIVEMVGNNIMDKLANSTEGRMARGQDEEKLKYRKTKDEMRYQRLG